jgi:hypothetical protein
LRVVDIEVVESSMHAAVYAASPGVLSGIVDTAALVVEALVY